MEDVNVPFPQRGASVDQTPLTQSANCVRTSADMMKDTTLETLETAGVDAPAETSVGGVACESCGGQCPARGLCAAAVEVVTEWMLDFMFLYLYQHFKLQHMEDFELCRNMMEDAQFEKDENITPLEAALIIWESIEREPEKFGTLHKEIQLLVQVQAVAVCMEKGHYKRATEVLERLFGEADSNSSIRTKLAAIISKKDPYHQFLQGFTYKQMLKKIMSFIDIVFSETPKSFLLKVATKVVEAKKEATTSQFDENRNEIEIESEIKSEKEKRSSTDYNSSSSTNKEGDVHKNKDADVDKRKDSIYRIKKRKAHTVHNPVEEPSCETDLPKNEEHLRAHKRLFSAKLRKPWSPQQHSSRKKLAAHERKHDLKSRNSLPVTEKESSSPSNTPRKKKRQLWVQEEDEQLVKGVKEFGVGNWSQILFHYKFSNRTGVMLKDRWRTMKKLHLI
ncbi:telomeric repeat-binding factor 1 isoform X2 [Ambystoma mexicanum]|uniref:telomeric repeat-binding factor 1 isoform X2 n=1 Tax=Ambystoma mexicanum TaxID=8296 RepID=UPI0037E915AC